MNKNLGFSRSDYLSLNTKDIKNHLRPTNRTKFAVTEDGVDKANLERSSWVLSSSNQFAVSRNKIGKTLLKDQHYDFLLDDPLMNKTRFFVEYNRLHDPSLEVYYNSRPVRNRLEQQCLITKENDAVCSTKEFAEYLRYLDSLKSMSFVDFIKNTVGFFRMKLLELS